ncbi:hypothetical protein BDN67DRAFT_510803 [Paxillus ammoniavirescens]|nr:hypothetical protein BDN67DRAFT_510803 [Paxillus ammoniavirescens]
MPYANAGTPLEFRVTSDPGTQQCDANIGVNRTVFLPEFSATCPHVTSVGVNIVNVPETAVLFSGGGFSNYVGISSW